MFREWFQICQILNLYIKFFEKELSYHHTSRMALNIMTYGHDSSYFNYLLTFMKTPFNYHFVAFH